MSRFDPDATPGPEVRDLLARNGFGLDEVTDVGVSYDPAHPDWQRVNVGMVDRDREALFTASFDERLNRPDAMPRGQYGPTADYGEG